MKIALCQMSCIADKSRNLIHARELVAKAAENGADIVTLPEMFCCEYRNSAFVENRESAGGSVWSALSNMAGENGVYLIGGSMPEADGDKTYNTSFVFDRQGRQIARHRKMHLFDINVDGGQHFQESRTFSAGSDVTVFDTEFGKMGLIICFDIRFPELSRLTALRGAQAVFCPAAFNMTTGPAHWEPSFRGRAVENQVFFIGCAPALVPGGCYASYGNSILVSPWGDVLARADNAETIIYGNVDLALVESTRRQLPLMSSRRTDVYSLETL